MQGDFHSRYQLRLLVHIFSYFLLSRNRLWKDRILTLDMIWGMFLVAWRLLGSNLRVLWVCIWLDTKMCNSRTNWDLIKSDDHSLNIFVFCSGADWSTWRYCRQELRRSSWRLFTSNGSSGPDLCHWSVHRCRSNGWHPEEPRRLFGIYLEFIAL